MTNSDTTGFDLQKKSNSKPTQKVTAGQKEAVQYFINSTDTDQAIIGPDGASRVIPPASFVHRSQFGNPNLPDKCARKGIFVGVRNEKSISTAGTIHRKLIVGGPLNNSKGYYQRGEG